MLKCIFFSGFQIALITLLFALTINGFSDECPQDYSSIPNYFSCESFFNCTTGEKILESCPTGTYYNCMNQTCGPKTFDFCCPTVNHTIYIKKNGVDFPCSNGTIARHHEYKNVYYICVNGSKILTGYCDPGFSYCEASKSCYLEGSERCNSEVNHIYPIEPFSTTAGFWISSAPWVICPNDNNSFSDQNNCTAYYNCSTGVAQLYRCPAGFYYDCFNNICSTFTNRFCCNGDQNVPSINLIVSNLYRCNDGAVISSKDFDNIYLQCYKNNIFTGECDDLR